MSRRNQTPNPVFSDGIHFARPASKMDQHSMRWVVGAHRSSTSKFARHVPTREEAVALAQRTTKAWLKQHPEEQHLLKVEEPTVPPASSNVVLQPFSTQHFVCEYANPYAQVWRCLADTAERLSKPAPGRPRKDGTRARATEVPHRYGDCAVLIGREPVRDPDGQVSVFSPAAAEEHAYDLYLNAPEDEVISWKPGDVVVGATRHVNIHFKPRRTDDPEPFFLYIPHLKRAVKKDLTRPTMYADDPIPAMASAQDRIELERRRKERQSIDRQYVFSDEDMRFKTIWGAEEEADRRQKMIEGVPV